MKKSLKVVFLVPATVLLLTSTAIAQTIIRETKTPSTENTPNQVTTEIKSNPSRRNTADEISVQIRSNAKLQAIECCTTFDTANGTTGCASFQGDTCPDYASFEAIPNKD